MNVGVSDSRNPEAVSESNHHADRPGSEERVWRLRREPV